MTSPVGHSVLRREDPDLRADPRLIRLLARMALQLLQTTDPMGGPSIDALAAQHSRPYMAADAVRERASGHTAQCLPDADKP